MKLSCVFNELMRTHHRQAVLVGGATASTPEEFFGFHHGEVERKNSASSLSVRLTGSTEEIRLNLDLADCISVAAASAFSTLGLRGESRSSSILGGSETHPGKQPVLMPLLTHCSHHFELWGSSGGKDGTAST
jgi:hypothetical protein